MDVLHEQVDRGDEGAAARGHGRVVAHPDVHPGGRGRQRLAQLSQQVELPHRPPLSSLRGARVAKVTPVSEGKQPVLHRLGELGSRIGSRPPRSKRVRIALQLGIAVLIFAFLVLTVAAQWGEIQEEGIHFKVGWLIPAFIVIPLFYVMGGVGWDLILRFLGYRIGLLRAQVAWGQPLLARYVPGSVLYLLARLLLAERAGVPRRTTLASIVYEQALSAAAAVLVATYFLIDHPDLQGQPLRWGVLAVVPLALIVLHPRVFRPAADWLLAKFGREPLPGRDADEGRRRDDRLLRAQLEPDRPRGLLRGPRGQLHLGRPTSR